MKSVLISIQPYWVFLIVAKKMCWNINREKTIEVRKNYPIDKNWDKIAKIYCSKDKKSFAKIPKEYQPLMERLLGKVIGEFICDKITDCRDIHSQAFFTLSCMSLKEWTQYTEGHKGAVFAWHISDLVIYDKPRVLSEFSKYGFRHPVFLKRPPQSWCYVEEII